MATCEWVNWGWEQEDTWHTSCDQDFSVMEGTPKENHFQYCPYCGKTLVEVQAPEEEEEKDDVAPD